MPLINLLHHIQSRSGVWQDEALLKNASPPFVFTLADTCAPDRLMLRWQHDCVVLVGPLRVRVTFQSENLLFGLSAIPDLQCADAMTSPPTTTTATTLSLHSLATLGTLALDAPPGALGLCASTVYSYVVDIAAGQAWPFILNELVRAIANNFGVRVLIEPAFETATSAAPARDLPCDFAVADVPDTARFFPAACEPCTPGALIGLPPSGPTLAIPAADGGCVRPRYYNGMFITKEDLETEQRYFRLKQKLQNRAAGSGVVWGLAVGRQGTAVCVAPGYAVDCCGNDLTVTTPYKVEIATLLRDPAAVATLASVPTTVFTSVPPVIVRVPPAGGDATGLSVSAGNRLTFAAAAAAPRGTRMHLLLEYVECPSDPRPVHADPCGGTANLCEMSRVRETVRLRLVPPRDLARSGPIQKFLDQVAALRAKYKLDDRPVAPAPDVPPFRIRIEWTDPNGTLSSRDFEPGQEPNSFTTGPITGIKVRLQMSGPSLFTGGRLDAKNLRTNELFQADLAPDGVDMKLPEVSAAGSSGELAYQLIDWRAQSILAVTGDVALGGNVKLQIAWDAGPNGGQITVPSTPANRVVERFAVTAVDVCGDPCLPAGAPPVTPHLPWLHDDPVDPSRAGDPKALLLAMLGGWLAKQLAAFGTGKSDQVFSVQRTIARALYEATWLLFYGVQQAPSRFDVGAVLRDLFRNWCDAFLWRGPACEGEPHGVVIGCALVAGGTIAEIDPLGGRRWVLHGPLLSHWAGQFGVAPLDVTMSHMIDGLCCVASLPAIGAMTAMRPVVIKLRAGLIAFGAPGEVIDELAQNQGVKTITGTATVSFPELVARAIEGASRSADNVNSAAATRYTLGAPMQDRVLSVFLYPERDQTQPGQGAGPGDTTHK